MNQITKTQQSAPLAVQVATSVNAQLKKNRDVIMATLPKGFNYDRMCRTVINAISTNAELAKCSPASIFMSTVRSFSLGIEPNGALAEGYLIPFWNSKKHSMEAQFMPSYRGLQALARRSGEIADVYAKEVREKDFFEAEEGTERKITHKPDYTKNRGDAVCYYAVFHTKDGSVDFEVMSKDEIDEIRRLSKSADRGPWADHYSEMAKKTVMKRLLKRAPMSIELASTINLDNKVASGEAVDDVLEIEGLEIDDMEQPEDLQKAVNADRIEDVKAKIEAKKQQTAPVDVTPNETANNGNLI